MQEEKKIKTTNYLKNQCILKQSDEISSQSVITALQIGSVHLTDEK